MFREWSPEFVLLKERGDSRNWFVSMIDPITLKLAAFLSTSTLRKPPKRPSYHFFWITVLSCLEEVNCGVAFHASNRLFIRIL